MNDFSWGFPSHGLQNQGTQFNFYFYWFVISTGWQCLTRLCNLTLLLFLPLPFCRNMLFQLKTTKQIHPMFFGWHHLKKKRKNYETNSRTCFLQLVVCQKGRSFWTITHQQQENAQCGTNSNPGHSVLKMLLAKHCSVVGRAWWHCTVLKQWRRRGCLSQFFADINNSLRSSLIAPPLHNCKII